MNKQAELDKIAKEIENCEICKEEKIGMAVPGEGDPDAEIVFIGEAPGKQEAATGRPFIGRSGKLLREMIRSIGLDDEKDVYITSPVKYLPKRGTPTSADIAHGRIHLMKQLEIIQPKVVVLMGRVAAEGVLSKKVSVVKEHGEVIEDLPAHSSLSDYAHTSESKTGRHGKDGIKYFLTYHPAAVLRFPDKYKAQMLEDFQKIKKLIPLDK